MTSGGTPINPGWFPDPTGRHQHRYWDGGDWTDSVADQGITAHDAPTFSPPTQPAPVAEPAQRGSTTVMNRDTATMRPGWYPDPTGPYQYRRWDGSGWRESISAEPLREHKVVHPLVVVARRIATVAAAVLIALGTLQVLLAVTVPGDTRTGKQHGDVRFGLESVKATRTPSFLFVARSNDDLAPEAFWATKGFDPGETETGLLEAAYAMGPVFLALLIARIVAAGRTSWPLKVRPTALGGERTESGVPRRPYLFSAKALTIRLGAVTALSAATVALYLQATSSINGDGYDIRIFGWIALALMVTMLLGDAVTLAIPGQRVRVDRFKHVYPEAAT